MSVLLDFLSIIIDKLYNRGPNITRCPHCADAIATFRGQLRIRNRRLTFQAERLLLGDEIEIENNPTLNIINKLKKYWTCYRDDKSSTIIQFVACNRCIRVDIVDYFTFVEEGWVIEQEYESIKL